MFAPVTLGITGTNNNLIKSISNYTINLLRGKQHLVALLFIKLNQV
jgi:hypothetical protein